MADIWPKGIINVRHSDPMLVKAEKCVIMKNIIKTPLAVVYLNDGFYLSIEDNLNLCKASQVWGVFFYDQIAKENVFLAKTNGPDIMLCKAYEWCHKAFSCVRLEKEDVSLYGGLPHYDELMALILGMENEVNATMTIFRKYGIVADNLFLEPYLAFSNETFENARALHLRELVRQKEQNEALMFKAVSIGDGGETVLRFTSSDLEKVDKFHTRLFLHQV